MSSSVNWKPCLLKYRSRYAEMINKLPSDNNVKTPDPESSINYNFLPHPYSRHLQYPRFWIM